MHELTGARKIPSTLRKFGFATRGFQLFLSAFRVLECILFDFPGIVLPCVCLYVSVCVDVCSPASEYECGRR